MMKKLVKIKLINWHYLINETIDIKGNVLITGENGAGKSTVLDAIQYVLTAGKQKFNTAANDKASRDLIGYVRCKTGHDSNQYERVGDVTSHISLEFYDESKAKPFIIGSVIDSASNLSYPKSIYYRIEDMNLSDDLFITKNSPNNIATFKAIIKNLNSKMMTTQEEARKDFCNRFGSLNERFVELLPKALAFRPINNVKDFVYSYLLDSKEIHIDLLKENIRTLTEFENYLKQVKEKIIRLEEISSIYETIQSVEENMSIQEYIVKRADKEINLLVIKNKELDVNRLGNNRTLANNEYNDMINKLSKERDYLSGLEKSLYNNDKYQLLKQLEKEKNDLKRLINELIIEDQKLNTRLKSIFDLILMLHEENIHLNNMEALYQYRNKTIGQENVSDFIELISEFNSELKNSIAQLMDERAVINIDRKAELQKLNSINEDIKILGSKKLIYPEYVTKLKNAITKDIKAELGIDIEPKVLCELLYMKDESWQNAVEGYLNTQRFNLIVEPEYFDKSLRIYERVKYQLNIHTAGLVNTLKLDEFASEKENSLGYVVGSRNKYAKNYVNMLLDRVITCNNVDELKLHPIAITKSCMVYQNKTARQIKEDVYKVPFIGQDAYKKQLELKLIEKAENEKRISELDKQINKINSILKILDSFELNYVKDHIFVKLNLQKANVDLTILESKLKEIDTSTFMDLEMKISQIQQSVKELENKSGLLNRNIAQLDFKIESIANEIKFEQNKQNEFEVELSLIETNILSILSKAEDRYKEALKDKDLYVVRDNYIRQRTGTESRLNNLLGDLRIKQSDYNRDNHFGAALGIEGIETFFSELKNLKDSKVTFYDEKIKESKKKAEEQFQDEFISKLQENILNAQREFRKLNDALKGISFGEDEYRFEYHFDKENVKFYDMIMDDSNIGGESLFSTSFRDKHKEALEALFEQISYDNEDSKKALEKYTDYRTYMDYDIKIIHSNGSTSSFSKVGREKSGGETQTPFYVAIAASFMQLYNTNQNDAIGLILFDEAFDKMDETRIESMMTFLNKLNLQIILASPPQKIESIAPYVKTTLVINREQNIAFIEEFHHNV